MLDWKLNLDPNFAANRFMAPRPVRPVKQMEREGYIENWICYRSADFSAKELTVLPGRTAKIVDEGAYGLIMVQGHGKMGVWDVDTPTLIRFGQLTQDEFFVTEDAGRARRDNRQPLADRPDRHAQALRTGEPGTETVERRAWSVTAKTHGLQCRGSVTAMTNTTTPLCCFSSHQAQTVPGRYGDYSRHNKTTPVWGNRK